MRVFINILLGITMTAITLWGVGALYFSPLLPARWRAFAAASYGDGKYFSLCTAAVSGQNGHCRARYLRSLGDLVPPHTRV